MSNIMKQEFQKYRDFQFETKAGTLEKLQSLLTKSSIPQFLYFSVKQWKKESEYILSLIKTKFDNSTIIVRSAACSEDTEECAMAGQFDSIPNVDPHDITAVISAVTTVVKSYHKKNNTPSNEDQILFQKMLRNVQMSGVLLTQDLNTGAPYYVINYDDETGRTDTVTKGGEYGNRTLFVHRESVDLLKSERFKKLLKAVKEIEIITEHDSLDIEFAVGPNNHVYILQVRKITTHSNWNRGVSLKITDSIIRITEFVQKYFSKMPGIFGNTTILGQMPDWNPAEMIGTSPRPLAFSLYEYLITKFAWRVARSQMGYFEPKGTPLMVSLLGRPYIDVRLSLNSFLPVGIDEVLGNKIVNAYIVKLAENKELHDKIEFDIAITCLCFDFDDKIETLYPGFFSQREKQIYRNALHQFTNRILTQKKVSIKSELSKINFLKNSQNSIFNKKNQKPDLRIATSLLQECIINGTIPFTILARKAFIAKSFLLSLITRGIMDESEILLFQRSIQTVAGELVNDLAKLSTGKLQIDEFMDQYGHLRPGTYDILSKRYDQSSIFLTEKSSVEKNAGEYTFSKNQLSSIQLLLNEYNFDCSADDLISFIRNSISAREYAKFVFTKSISNVLEIIAFVGQDIGLSREELSYLHIDDILNTINIVQGRSLEQFLREKSIQGKDQHEITLALKLPHLIEIPEDISIVPLHIHRPNFITQKRVKGEWIFLNGHNDMKRNIKNKIVLIEGADPGFDWIFACGITGLITKYGGINSHMAIRCAEFGLPASIGCGEQIFDRLQKSSIIDLNCSEDRIDIIEI